MWYETLIDRGLVPDWAYRFIVRFALSRYSGRIRRLSDSQAAVHRRQFLLKNLFSPIALETNAANLQHYEVPTEFSR